MKRLLFLAAFAVLSACAGQSLPPDKLAAIRTIGVVSIVGDDVSLTYATGYGMISYSAGHLDPWNADEIFAARLNASLAKRYQVVPVAYDRAAFPPEKPHEVTIEEEVRAGVRPLNLDAYVVVVRGASGFGGAGFTPRYAIGGLGLLRTPLILTSSYNVHSFYDIVVVDGHDYKVLARREASYPDTLFSFNAGLALQGPYRQVDESLWAPSFHQLSPQQKSQLASALDKLISDSLVVTLRDMKLLD